MDFYLNPHSVGCPWYNCAEKFGAPNIDWCEETLCQWISEPANTWSNAVYILSAFIIWRWAKKQKAPELKWFGPAMFIMGFFSWFYHLSLNFPSQNLDFLGMFIYLYWIVVLNFKRLDWGNPKIHIPLYIGFIIISMAFVQIMYPLHIHFQILVPVAAVLILVTEFLLYKRATQKIKYKAMLIGLSLIMIAEVFSILDQTRIFCDPTDHIIQGHAIWHILSAIGLTIATFHFDQFQFTKKNTLS